jgi:adenylyl- and sulfurtransferase ThiI
MDSTITIVGKNKHYFRELNQMLSYGLYQALVTGFILSNQPEKTLKDIQEYKKNLEVPILTPLISMDEKEIDTKTKELGFKL